MRQHCTFNGSLRKHKPLSYCQNHVYVSAYINMLQCINDNLEQPIYEVFKSPH